MHEKYMEIKQRNTELKAKDLLPNTNRMQAIERAEKCRFCR